MYSFTSGTIFSAGTCSPSMPGTQPVSLNISLASFRRAISSLVMALLMIASPMPPVVVKHVHALPCRCAEADDRTASYRKWRIAVRGSVATSRRTAFHRPGLMRFLQLLCDLAGAGGEKLRQWAERAVPQREYSDWIGTCRRLNWQQFERRVFAEAQHRPGKHRN